MRRGNKVEAGEPQTPLTPLAISQFRARGPKSGKGRISLGQDPALSVQYAGELLAAFIAKAGGSVKGKITTGRVPAGLTAVHVHQQSRTLAEILTDMLRGSNNYIANQIFLEIGGKRLGAPLGLEKSLKVAREILAKHDLAGAIQLVEGSGISHDNRFTARGLAKVLNLFAPHDALLVSSKDSAYKTGTLEGVRTLAGYANTSSHRAGALRDLAQGQQWRATVSVAPRRLRRSFSRSALAGAAWVGRGRVFYRGSSPRLSRTHCALMFAARMMRSYFSFSLRRCAAKSAPQIPTG